MKNTILFLFILLFLVLECSTVYGGRLHLKDNTAAKKASSEKVAEAKANEKQIRKTVKSIVAPVVAPVLKFYATAGDGSHPTDSTPSISSGSRSSNALNIALNCKKIFCTADTVYGKCGDYCSNASGSYRYNKLEDGLWDICQAKCIRSGDKCLDRCTSNNTFNGIIEKYNLTQFTTD